MSPRRSSTATRAQTRVMAEHLPEVVEGLLAETPVPERPYGTPAVVMVMGFPGVGKTHCARLLAARLVAAHVASDHLRSRLFVAASYAPDENSALFKVVDGLVERLLEAGHRVVVDATHLSARTRASVEALALRRGVPLRHVLVTSDEPDVLARLAGRRAQRAEHDRSDADERVYRAMRDRGFEQPAVPFSTIHNDPGLADDIERVAQELEDMWRAT